MIPKALADDLEATWQRSLEVFPSTEHLGWTDWFTKVLEHANAAVREAYEAKAKQDSQNLSLRSSGHRIEYEATKRQAEVSLEVPGMLQDPGAPVVLPAPPASHGSDIQVP